MDNYLLHEIFNIDCKIEELKKDNKINEMIKQLNAFKATYDESKARYEQLVIRVKDRHYKQKEIAEKIKMLYHEVEEAEKELYTSSNVKMINQLEIRIKNAKSQIKKLEDDAFDVLIEIENMTKEAQDLGTSLKQIKLQFDEVKEKINEKKVELEHNISELLKRRKELTDETDGNVLKEYEELKSKTGKGAAILINEGYCSACRIQLPMMFVEEIKDRKILTKCPNCKRFLLVD